MAENARICLHRLAKLLSADQRGPTPHLCVSFAATSRLLVTVSRLSAALDSDGVTYEALSICSLLIDSEEEAFLEDRAFADTLPDFVESVQRCARYVGAADATMTSSLLEMLFGLAAKIKAEPHMLRVWFRPEKPDEDDEELSDSERRTQFEEFPLFYLLLNYVTAQGRAGEFARMGMLYLVECTAHSPDLETWIVQGDMAALLASGLGALYSQLSRKIALAYDHDQLPPILKFSERVKTEPLADVERSTSAEYVAHLATFLSSLVFWQDLLEHCASNDVKQTLLDHYQFLFLQQLLYPSLLESSDIDGGSAVAVLVYLRHILGSIDHPDLVRLTFQYLFGHEVSVEEVVEEIKIKPVTRIRRRKSDVLFARLKSDEDSFSPDLFNLTDFIMTSLKSHNQQVVTATCELLSTLLRRPHHANQPNLLRTRPARQPKDSRTFGAHEKEVDHLLNLAESITAFQDLESSYGQHIQDHRDMLESHPCSVRLLDLSVASKTSNMADSIKNGKYLTRLLSTNDPILKGLVMLLEGFFKNDIETNLSLTQAIIDLASCGYLKLEGWLVTHPLYYRFSDDDDGASTGPQGADSMANSMMLNSTAGLANSTLTVAPEPEDSLEDKVHKIKLARRTPVWRSADAAPISAALAKLLAEAEQFQRDIHDFDASLLDCRTILEGRDPNQFSPSTPTMPPSHSKSKSQSRSPIRRPGTLAEDRLPSTPPPKHASPAPDSIQARVKSGTSESRTATPVRGRQLPVQLDEASTPKLVSRRLPHLQDSRSPGRSTSRGSVTAGLGRRYSASPTKLSKLLGQQQQPQLAQPPASPRFAGHFRRISDAFLGRKVKLAEERVVVGNAAGEESEDEDEDRLVEAEEDEDGESDAAADADEEGKLQEVSLGHLLTNVIVLQEFILELAALVEVRGSLFREVRQM